MNKTLKIAHRGAKGYEPENSLAAFQKALDMGADGIELDVHLSFDEHLIVIHDESIDRTTNGKGFVNQMTLDELKKVSSNEVLKIPTLEEVLDLVDKKCFVNIELKAPKTPEKIEQLIEKYITEKNWDYTHFLISSFDWNTLEQVHFLNDKIPIGVLTEIDLDLSIAFAKFIRAKAIHPDFHLLNEVNIQKMQDNNLLVFPWTVNNLEDIQKLKQINVNGIITDFIDRI